MNLFASVIWNIFLPLGFTALLVSLGVPPQMATSLMIQSVWFLIDRYLKPHVKNGTIFYIGYTFLFKFSFFLFVIAEFLKEKS